MKRSLYDICVLLTKGQSPGILSQEFTMTTKTRVMNKIPTGVWKIHTIKLRTRSASKSNFNPWQDHENEHKSESSSGSCNIKTTEQHFLFYITCLCVFTVCDFERLSMAVWLIYSAGHKTFLLTRSQSGPCRRGWGPSWHRWQVSCVWAADTVEQYQLEKTDVLAAACAVYVSEHAYNDIGRPCCYTNTTNSCLMDSNVLPSVYVYAILSTTTLIWIHLKKGV